MRMLIRVALGPVGVALTVLQWAVLFVSHFVGIGCYLMAGFCFIFAVAGWLMGLATIEETIRTLGIGFGFFVVPMIGTQVASAVCVIHRFVVDM